MAINVETVMQLSKRYADDVRRAMPVDKAYSSAHTPRAPLTRSAT